MQQLVIWFALIGLILFISQWFYQHVFAPRRERRRLRCGIATPALQRLASQIDALYKDNPAYYFAKQQAKLQGEAFIYGEIVPLSFLPLLTSLPRPVTTYCDLGSGGGKSVLTASVSGVFQQAIGAEILQPLHDIALHKAELCRQQFGNNCEMTFYCIDFLQMNLNDIDVVFINAVAFRGELWRKLVYKLVEEIDPGCFVMITSHLLPEPQFKLIHGEQTLMSWGLNSLRIYERV